LTGDEKNILSPVTIVGMRFYAGAHDIIHKASKEKDVFDQCLYLVAEKDNKYDTNAVMLHNGKMKLGSVEKNDAAKVKRLLAKWLDENGGDRNDDVVVVRCSYIGTDPSTFAFAGSVQVRGMYRVNERLARKFSNQHRKD
jgi:hypothetical protein